MYDYTNELGGLPPSIFFYLFSYKAALPILLTLPLTLAALGTMVAFRRIRSRALFFLISFLSMVGIQSFIIPVTPLALIHGNQTYFLVASKIGMDPGTATGNAFYAALWVVFVGVPLMYWLYRVFRRLTLHSSGTR